MTASILFGLALGVGAPAIKDKPGVAEEPYGVWELERSEGGKAKAGPPGKGPLRYKFNKDGTWMVMEGDRDLAGPRPFKFDPKATPATIDTCSSPGQSKPDVLGIYKIEGDRLTLCKGYPGTERPKEFSVPDGSSNYLMVFRRVRSKD